MDIDHRTCVVNQPVDLDTSDWTSFLFSMEVLLAKLVLHGRAFGVFVVDRPDDAFVQFCITAEGWVSAEATNSVLRPGCCVNERHRLLPRQEALLPRLGWRAPERHVGGRLLWHRDADPQWPYVAPLYAELLTRTLVEVFEVDKPDMVKARLGNMPRAGGGLARVTEPAA